LRNRSTPLALCFHLSSDEHSFSLESEYAPAQIAAMSAAQMEAYRTAEASTVKGPYLFIAAIFIVVAVFIQLAHLPNCKRHREAGVASVNGISQSILSHAHLVKASLLSSFTGAQVESPALSFVTHSSPFRNTCKTAALYLLLHQIGFMAGRFIGSAIMKRIAAPRLCRSSPRHR